MLKKLAAITLMSLMCLTPNALRGADAPAADADRQAAYHAHTQQLITDPSLIRLYTFEEGQGVEITNHVRLDPSQRAVTGGPLGSLSIQLTKGPGHAPSTDPALGPPPTWTQGRWPWKAAIQSGYETVTNNWEAAKLFRSGITGKEFAEGGTFAAWFRMHETTEESASCSLIKLGDGFGSGFDLSYLKAKWRPDGQLTFKMGARGENIQRVSLIASPVSVGVWHHVAVTFDASTAKLYLDGALAAESAVPVPLIPTTHEDYPLVGPFHEFGTPSRFGSYLMIAHNPAREGTVTARFDIDELAIYNRVIPASTLAAEAKAGQPAASAEQQLAAFRSLAAQRAAVDAVRMEVPTDSGGYVRSGTPFTAVVEVPADTPLVGPLTAVFELETLEGKPLQTLRQSVVAGTPLRQDFTLTECGVYNLGMTLLGPNDTVLKRLPRKTCIAIVTPAPERLTEHNPLAFWADLADTFYFDVPSRRMNYFGPRNTFNVSDTVSPTQEFTARYNAYAARIPDFRAFVWFYSDLTGTDEATAYNEALFTDAIRLFKTLKVFGLEVSSEPHTSNIPGYVAMLKTLRGVIDREGADLQVVPPGAAPPSIAMISEILKQGGAQYVDGLSYHPYTANPIGDYLWNNRTARLQAVADEYPERKFFLWNTECTVGSLPRMQGRPMTRADAFAARFGVSESHGHPFFPYFVPLIPEREAAGLQCHGILLDLLQGYKLYTIHTSPNVDGLPSLKGVAITALAGQILNRHTRVSRLPMATVENFCVLIDTTDAGTVAAIFGMDPKTVTFKLAPNGVYRTMDMLGNDASITANADGLITVNSSKSPVYIFGVPADMTEVVPLTVAAPAVLPEDRLLHATITVRNPFKTPLAGTLAARDIPGAAIHLDSTSVQLAPGETVDIPLTLTASFLKRRDYLLSVDLNDPQGSLLANAQTIFTSNGVIQMIPAAPQPITLDGDTADWQGIEGVVCDDADSVVHGKPNYAEVWVPQWTSKEDLSVELKTAWRPNEGIYFLLNVTDNAVVPAPAEMTRGAFRYDCLELFFDGRRLAERGKAMSVGVDQIIIRPQDTAATEPCTFWFPRKNVDDVMVGLQCVSRTTATGYVIEGMLTPKPGLDFKLLPGSQFLMDFLVDDTDSLEPKLLRKAAMAVHGTFNNFVNPNLWGRYELAAPAKP